VNCLSAGRIADRYGHKATLLAGIVVFSVFIFVAAFAEDTMVTVACRFIAGSDRARSFRCRICSFPNS
jgi:MFS family permease